MDDVQLPPEFDQAFEEGKDRELLKRVALGQDFENFIKSQLGRHLCACAESERSAVLEKLATLDPRDDEKAMRRAQQRIAVIDSWQEWIAQAVNEGVLAEREFLVRNE